MNGKFQSTAVFTPRTTGVKGTQCPCAGAPAGMILDLAHALRGGVLRGVAPSRVHECRRDCQLHVKEFATFGSACRQQARGCANEYLPVCCVVHIHVIFYLRAGGVPTRHTHNIWLELRGLPQILFLLQRRGLS